MSICPILLVTSLVSTLHTFSSPELLARPAGLMDPELSLHYQAALKDDDHRTLSFFVQTHDVLNTTAAIESVGGVVTTIAGDVLTVRVPAHGFEAVMGLQWIERMEAMKPVDQKLDRARMAVRIDEVAEGAAPLTTGYTGAGVILGIIDRGFDLDHAAFRRSDGTSRVLAVWDQTATTGEPPGGRWTYGTACDARAIETGCAFDNPAATHGTHVAGIAGGGQVGSHPWVGVAPNADLIFVELPAMTSDWETTPEPASDGHICDGVACIFAQAYEQNKPAVVNMSLGSHWGPHDASSLASRCLTNLSQQADGTGVPGKILVAAAGNEGAGGGQGFVSWGDGWERTPSFTHASAVLGTQPLMAPFRLGVSYQLGTQLEPVDIYEDLASFWFDTEEDLLFRLGVMHSPTEITWTPAKRFSELIVESHTEMLVGNDVVGHVALFADQMDSGARCFRAYVSDWNQDGREGEVVFVAELTQDGSAPISVDGFMEVSNEVRAGGFLDIEYPAGQKMVPDNNMSIGFPGNGPTVLAVASFISRKAMADGSESPEQNRSGDRASSSSRGPTRNIEATGLKPDIAAPGQYVVAPLSGDYEASEIESFFLEDLLVFEGSYGEQNSYIAFEGTSMASPIVAGTVALMLEADPELSVDRIRELFEQTAIVDEFTGPVPNTNWGRGKLDAFAVMQAVANPGESGCRSTSAVLWWLLALGLGARRRLSGR
ncbi:MAG: S8 family serine peptidase [Myxococcota bacterium]|nr:S8 family serine peptidase [Myxococcota bacterium]